MSLTLDVELKLKNVGLVDFFTKSKKVWLALAKHSFQFVSQNFPTTATIRTDDVAKALVPVLEVNESLRNYLSADKLSQKYWFRHFADLILDRCWADIIK